MKNVTEIMTAIALFAFAVGLVVFMATLGTLLAPIALFILGVAMIILIMRELEKKPRNKKRRRK
ncbi:hypothetical protein J7J63_05825 [Candidatus Bipolaricaulota bacterium]|nr:hypothetical protein [Candidatus Bipolaricaulota bacterium]